MTTQHEMPFETATDLRAFKSLDSFTQGYIHAIFFTECHCDNPELEDATFADMSAEAIQQAIDDCAEFAKANEANLTRAKANRDNYDDEQAGADFWFTRNRHGAGFWDRGLGIAGDWLSDAAKVYGSCDLYRGDDGKLYLS